MASDVVKVRYWREHMKGWQASGMSQRGYCQREGLALSSFDHWRRRLKQIGVATAKKRPTRSEAPLTLLPVRVIPEPMPGGLSLTSPGGWQMTFPSVINAEWLGDVILRLP